MRELNHECLMGRAQHYASEWLQPDVMSKSGKIAIAGRAYVMADLARLTFKDEFEAVQLGVKEFLGGRALAEFEARCKEELAPRDEKVFVKLLREKLAIDPTGKHIEGAIGTTQVGVRPIAIRSFRAEALDSIRRRKRLGLKIHDPDRTDRELVTIQRLLTWPVFAGEAEERRAGNVTPIGKPGADELPDDAFPTLDDGRMPGGVGANVPTISAEAAVAAMDAVVDRLDEGTTAATIRGRTGTQPADPDATETGTLLFTLTMSDPAFAAAADDGDGTVSATADTVTDDSAADATGTLGYCRAGATGTGADDHIDGEAAAPSGGDFNFNTLSIVTGAVISMSSFVVNLSQGSTAS